MPIAFVDADMLRTAVRFEDLIEPVSVAFQRYSQRQASSELIMMWPAADPDAGDVYVKTGTIVGHSSFVVKVSPWFAVNAEQKRPQGGFIALCDAETGHTRAIIMSYRICARQRLARWSPATWRRPTLTPHWWSEPARRRSCSHRPSTASGHSGGCRSGVET